MPQEFLKNPTGNDPLLPNPKMQEGPGLVAPALLNCYFFTYPYQGVVVVGATVVVTGTRQSPTPVIVGGLPGVRVKRADGSVRR